MRTTQNALRSAPLSRGGENTLFWPTFCDAARPTLQRKQQSWGMDHFAMNEGVFPATMCIPASALVYPSPRMLPIQGASLAFLLDRPNMAR